MLKENSLEKRIGCLQNQPDFSDLTSSHRAVARLSGEPSSVVIPNLSLIFEQSSRGTMLHLKIFETFSSFCRFGNTSEMVKYCTHTDTVVARSFWQTVVTRSLRRTMMAEHLASPPARVWVCVLSPASLWCLYASQIENTISWYL